MFKQFKTAKVSARLIVTMGAVYAPPPTTTGGPTRDLATAAYFATGDAYMRVANSNVNTQHY